LCHLPDKYAEGLLNDRPVDNAHAYTENAERRLHGFHRYLRPASESRATCSAHSTMTITLNGGKKESIEKVPALLRENIDNAESGANQLSNMELARLEAIAQQNVTPAQQALDSIRKALDAVKAIGVFGN